MLVSWLLRFRTTHHFDAPFICTNATQPENEGMSTLDPEKGPFYKETIYSNHQLFREHVGFQGGSSTFGFVLNMLHMLTADLGVFQYVTNLT